MTEYKQCQKCMFDFFFLHTCGPLIPKESRGISQVSQNAYMVMPNRVQFGRSAIHTYKHIYIHVCIHT